MGSYVPSTGKEAADRRFRVSGRTQSINQRQFSWVPRYPTRAREQPTAESRVSVRGVSTNRKNSKCQKSSDLVQVQKLEYLSFYLTELLQILTQYSWKVGLWMVQALIGDVKDFWRYSTFSDGRKSAIFVRFSAEKHCFLASK